MRASPFCRFVRLTPNYAWNFLQPLGHLSRDCTEPRQGGGGGGRLGGRDNIQCYRCQGYGHMSRECTQWIPAWDVSSLFHQSIIKGSTTFEDVEKRHELFSIVLFTYAEGEKELGRAAYNFFAFIFRYSMIFLSFLATVYDAVQPIGRSFCILSVLQFTPLHASFVFRNTKFPIDDDEIFSWTDFYLAFVLINVWLVFDDQ